MLASHSAASRQQVQSSILVLCRGNNHAGRAFWVYMCMLPNQAELFCEARRQGRMDLEDYGTVLEFGEGAEPPPEVRERMRQEFGFRDDFEETLLKLIAQQGG